MFCFTIYQKSILFLLILHLNCFSLEGYNSLKLVTGNDYSPYSDEKLKDGGIFTSIVKKILSKLNMSYTLDFLPWARGYDMVKNSKYDATFPYVFTKERSFEVNFSKVSLVEIKSYIFTNNKNKKNIEDFKGLIYCHSLGYFIEKPIQKILENNETKKIQKFDQLSCINSIINFESDFTVLNDDQFNEYKKMKIKNFNVINKVDILININNLYIAFRKDIKGDIIKKIDEEAKNYIKTDEYNKIRYQN
jgi:polar amino acid transport system substrate-binding protein